MGDFDESHRLTCDELFRESARGNDFHYFQDLGEKVYEEHYYNPDCILLFPATEDVIWFDLDYTTVYFDILSKVREHRYGSIQKKKFAFSSRDNQMCTLDYSLLYSLINSQTEMKPQNAVGVRYLRGREYEKVAEFDPATTGLGANYYKLEQLWKQHQQLKISVTFDKCILIYPIRLAYRHGDVYSFSSKSVVIPNQSLSSFSWKEVSLGNICISTDGSCSIFRETKPENRLERFIPTIFPKLSDTLSRVLDDPSAKHVLKYRMKSVLNSIIRIGHRYILPYEIEHRRLPFSVYCTKTK